MPIFRKGGKSILFIHVPKCGGSSIENAFRSSGYGALYLDGRMGRQSPNHLRRCSPQHMHADLLRRVLRIDRCDAAFMVVRDPVARFRSEYVYDHRALERISPDPADVEAWADRVLGGFADDPYIRDNHIRPQHEFWVPQALVYRMEDGLDNIVDDLNRRFRLGVAMDPAPAKHGKAAYGLASAEVQLTDAVRGRVESFYARDYAKFGYGDGIAAAVRPRLDRAAWTARRPIKWFDDRARAVVRRTREAITARG